MRNIKTFIVTLSLIAIVLTACSTTSTPTEEPAVAEQATLVSGIVSATQTYVASSAIEASTEAPATVSTLTADYTDAASIEMQLLVGILKLENTDLAITSSQAESLITLLKTLQEASNTASQEQIDAMIQQAQSILSAEQVTAIANLQLTQESAMAVLQEQGLAQGNPQQRGGNQPAQGEMPQGTPPAGGGPGGNGQPPDASQMGTPPANGMQAGTGVIPPQLLDMIIQLLETKVSS